jgi:hypothetical protein
MSARNTRLRFLGIVALLAIPSVWFGVLFVQQSQTAIDVANNEIAGIDYIRAIMPLYFEVEPGGVARTEAVKRFRNARREMDRQLRSHLQAEAVSVALDKEILSP